MAGTWRLAYSLVRLREQLNARWPNRNKASDGTIGDASHAAGASDHNPNRYGVVCAMDITHSPQTGFNAHALADRLAGNPHPDLKYIISNGRITSANVGWRWIPYSGGDPHVTHIHISTGRGGDGQSSPPYDDTQDWDISGQVLSAKAEGEEMPITREDVERVHGMSTDEPIGADDYKRWVDSTEWSKMIKSYQSSKSREGFLRRVNKAFAATSDDAVKKLQQIKEVLEK